MPGITCKALHKILSFFCDALSNKTNRESLRLLVAEIEGGSSKNGHPYYYSTGNTPKNSASVACANPGSRESTDGSVGFSGQSAFRRLSFYVWVYQGRAYRRALGISQIAISTRIYTLYYIKIYINTLMPHSL